MRVFIKNKRLFQAAALTILLAGLLFSNGEGIRLLPFPAAERTACGIEKLAPVADAGYEENVARFEKRQNSLALKNLKADSCPAEAFGGVIVTHVTLSPSNYIAPRTDFALYSTRKHASDLNSRPPPIS